MVRSPTFLPATTGPYAPNGHARRSPAEDQESIIRCRPSVPKSSINLGGITASLQGAPAFNRGLCGGPLPAGLLTADLRLVPSLPNHHTIACPDREQNLAANREGCVDKTN